MHELLGCELGVSLCVTALQEPELHGAMAFYCAVVKIQLGSALITPAKFLLISVGQGSGPLSELPVSFMRARQIKLWTE